MHISILVYECVCVYILVYECVCVYICVHEYVYMYINIYCNIKNIVVENELKIIT